MRDKLTSRQFLITMTALGLTFAATWHGADVTQLAMVSIVAISGQAGVNALERKAGS